MAQANVEEAQSLGRSLSMCMALGEAACPIAIMTGDFPAAENYLAALMEAASRQGLSFWIGMGRCLEGKLLIRRGEVKRGTALLQDAIGAYRIAQQSLHYSGFVADLAEGLAMDGRAGEGTAIIEEALTRSNSSGVRWHAAELMRVGAGLRLAGARDPQLLEQAMLLRSALDVARDQGALFWELRAALSLAQVEARRGDGEKAERLLKGIFDRVTGSFETPDVQAIKRMLAGISTK
ncbi:hypothetical protein [Dankookia sp. P2]|uniref:hypothetical protein n=1 Tax=Dankookia sp. P2 TaxID=3423955 RepID=UPI003D66F8A8